MSGCRKPAESDWFARAAAIVACREKKTPVPAMASIGSNFFNSIGAKGKRKSYDDGSVQAPYNPDHSFTRIPRTVICVRRMVIFIKPLDDNGDLDVPLLA
jgi:hypothetical protein